MENKQAGMYPWTHLSSSLNKLTIIRVHFYVYVSTFNKWEKMWKSGHNLVFGERKIFDIHCRQGKCNNSSAHWTERGLHVQINYIYPSSGCLISHSRNTAVASVTGLWEEAKSCSQCLLKRSRGSQNSHLDQLWLIHWDINYVKYLMNPKLP